LDTNPAGTAALIAQIGDFSSFLRGDIFIMDTSSASNSYLEFDISTPDYLGVFFRNLPSTPQAGSGTWRALYVNLDNGQLGYAT
ncbi:MAG: hypothetical protein WC554_07790, partial [Clostridia bacterium]